MRNSIKEILLLEIVCTGITIELTKSDFLKKNNTKINSVINKIENEISVLICTTITRKEIAILFVNRHEKFLNGDWSVSKKDKIRAKVTGNSNKNCEWPTTCSYIGNTDLDHIIPQSAYSNDLDFFFQDNSMNLCPIHNRVIKRDNIMIGLWLRNLITFNTI